MLNLSFTWQAILKNSKIIYQFDSEGKEHRFQEVKDNFDKLTYFNLTNNKGKLFSVDLLNGLIGYNNLTLSYIEPKEKKNNIRLIYFRRNIITTDITNLNKRNHIIYYFLGLQWNDLSGNNHKILLKIDKEGNFIIGG